MSALFLILFAVKFQIFLSLGAGVMLLAQHTLARRMSAGAWQTCQRFTLVTAIAVPFAAAALSHIVTPANVLKPAFQIEPALTRDIPATQTLTTVVRIRDEIKPSAFLPSSFEGSAVTFSIFSLIVLLLGVQFFPLLEASRMLAGWNPLVRRWLDRIEVSDEFACDEALLGRQSVEPTAYATCLYEVARVALKTRAEAKLAGTAGMAAAPHFLKRRIEMIFQKRKESRLLKAAFLVLSFTSLCTVASD